jgi:hypothetical protein
VDIGGDPKFQNPNFKEECLSWNMLRNGIVPVDFAGLVACVFPMLRQAKFPWRFPTGVLGSWK